MKGDSSSISKPASSCSLDTSRSAHGKLVSPALAQQMMVLMSECSSRSTNNNTRHYPPFDLTPDPRFGPPSAPFPPCADTNDISTSTAPARITACTSSAPSWRATETPDARQVRTNRTYSCLATVHSAPVNDTPGRVSRRSHAALDIGRSVPGATQSISSTKDRDRCYQEAGSSSTSETPRGSLDQNLPTDYQDQSTAVNP